MIFVPYILRLRGVFPLKGPEWGWPLGYFLRAYLYFDTRIGAGKEVGPVMDNFDVYHDAS